MDAVKIIKKHGQPSGLPVVTAYVDENAPGESVQSKKYYYHNVQLVSCSILLITDDPTPFTTITLAKFMYDSGYRNADSGIFINTIAFQSPSQGSVVVQKTPKIYSTQGTTLRSEYTNQEIKVVDGILVLYASAVQTVAVSVLSDIVNEI